LKEGFIMNRRTYAVLAAVAVVIIGGLVWNAYRAQSPVVQISTDAAKVSIGASGVSVSVAPSADP
jgi:hypothetical protein